MPPHRIDEIYFPRVEQPEPLSGLIEHSHAVIAARERSIMDGGRDVRIVRMLTGAQHPLDQGLKTSADLRSPDKPSGEQPKLPSQNCNPIWK